MWFPSNLGYIRVGEFCSSVFNHLRHKDVALPRVGPRLVGGAVGPHSTPTLAFSLSQLGNLFWPGRGEDGGHGGGGGGGGGGGHGHGGGSRDLTSATPTSASHLEK